MIATRRRAASVVKALTFRFSHSEPESGKYYPNNKPSIRILQIFTKVYSCKPQAYLEFYLIGSSFDYGSFIAARSRARDALMDAECSVKNSSEKAGHLGWITALGVSMVFPLAVALQPRPGEPIAVVFPPWIDSAEATERVWRADGEAAGFGALANVVIAQSERPGFFAALRNEGALFSMDATLAGAICIAE